MEIAPLPEAVLRESGRRDPVLTRLFADISSDGCSVGDSPLRALAYRVAALSRPVEICLSRQAIEALDEVDRYSLASLADHPCVSIVVLQQLPGAKEAAIVAEVQTGSASVRWASQDVGTRSLGEHWGETSAPLIYSSALQSLSPSGEKLEADAIRPKRMESGDREIAIHHELDGDVQGFGKRFWALIATEHKETQDVLDSEECSVVSVEYSDRYLFTPLSVAVLLQVLQGLRSLVGPHRWKAPICIVTTARSRSAGGSRGYGAVYSDWADTTMRDRVLLASFDQAGMKAELRIPEKVKHGRLLVIEFSNNKTLTLRFDQGVSYWRVPQLADGRKVDVSYSSRIGQPDAITEQARKVVEMRLPLEGAMHPTEIFAKARPIG